MTKAPDIKQICLTMVTLLALLASAPVIAQSMGGTPASEKSYGGIVVYSADANSLSGNAVQDNSYGIYIRSSTGNVLWSNTISNNGRSVYARYGTNMWNSADVNQYTYKGHIYSNYTCNFRDDYSGKDVNDDHYPMLRDMPSMMTGRVQNTRTGMTYKTIQAALNDDNTNNGDTILVSNGTYRENVAVSKAIDLTGSGSPVVDGSGGNYSIWIEADGVTLQGFNVTNASNAVLVTSSHDRLTGNSIYHNFGDQGNGIYVTGSYNELTNNSAWGNSNNGIKVLGSFNSISGNFAYANACGGIGVNGSNNVIANNSADGNSIDIWISGSLNKVMGNIATGGDYGIEFYQSTNDTVMNNTIRGNDLGLQLFDSTETVVWLNQFDSNRENAVMTGSPNNRWNSSMPLQYTYSGHMATSYIGNYWSDYQGQDANSDGIGDTPYDIDPYNQDLYPMLHGTAITESDAGQDTAPYTTFVVTRGEIVN